MDDAAATVPDPGSHQVRQEIERRLATGLAYVRAAMAVLVLVPFIHLGALSDPGLALAGAAVAIAESVWMFRRVRRRGTVADPRLCFVDALCAAAVAAAFSRSVPPPLRDSGMIEVLSFGLASAGIAGFGLGSRPLGAVLAAGLAAVWAAAIWPDWTVKVLSDTLGFGLWYAVSVLTGHEFRRMAELADRAHAQAALAQADLLERRRRSDVGRQREVTHREIHDHLLPVVDAVAAGRGADPHLAAVARREAQRARRLLTDGRARPEGSLHALLVDVRDTYVEAGLPLVAALHIESEPPPAVAEAVAAAAREALTNVLKYAEVETEVTLFAEAADGAVEVVVRDHGVGFDPEAVRPGGGMSVTFAAVQRQGGEVLVRSSPGVGTRVSILWPARPGAGERAIS